MISHSLIVCALLALSLAAEASAVSIDDALVDSAFIKTSVAVDAVLHKDMGLQQGGGTGKDAMEAQVIMDACDPAVSCENDPTVNSVNASLMDDPLITSPKVETMDGWFALRKNESDANPLIAILLILASTFFYLRRSTSTK